MKYFIIILTLFLDSCGIKGDISTELEKTRKTIEKASDNLAKAVPGERYHRLIDGMADKSTREDTKKLIESIFGLKIGHKTMIHVSFAYEENPNLEPLTGSAFFSRINNRTSVESALKSNVVSSLQSIKNKGFSPYTDDEIRQIVKSKIREYYTNIVGHYATNKIARGSLYGSWYNAKSPEFVINSMVGVMNHCTKEQMPYGANSNNIEMWKTYVTNHYECAINKAIKPLFEAFMAEYKTRDISIGKGDISKQWVFSQGRFMIIVLDEKQFNAYKDSLKVSYTMEVRNEANVVIKRYDSKPININFFLKTTDGNDKSPVKAYQLDTNLVWAAVNLDGEIFSSDELNFFKQQDAINLLLDKIERKQERKSRN